MRNARLSFDDVARLVLQGFVAVETADGVAAWPAVSSRVRGSVAVLMHRRIPGAVVLAGDFKGDFVLTGCYSSLLRDYLKKDRAEFFDFANPITPEGGVRFLFDAVLDASSLESSEDDFYSVCGVDGAELLSELRRVSVSSEKLH